MVMSCEKGIIKSVTKKWYILYQMHEKWVAYKRVDTYVCDTEKCQVNDITTREPENHSPSVVIAVSSALSFGVTSATKKCMRSWTYQSKPT